MKKTGTTIVGLQFDSGIILASDTRATNGPVAVEKNCFKQHRISPNIVACGAGTAADTQNLTLELASKISHFHTTHQRWLSVKEVVNSLAIKLFNYRGYLGGAFIIGGVGHENELYSISPNGYSSPHYFTAMGSGSYAAIGILENGFIFDNGKVVLSELEGIKLAVNAVRAGAENDLYSGRNVDICVMKQGSTEYFRNAFVITEQSDYNKFIKKNVEYEGEERIVYQSNN